MVSLAAVPAAQAAASAAGSASAAPAGGSATPRVDAGRVPAGDEVVTAKVDSAGYHLFAASSGDGWAWHALATIQPGGHDDEQWTGEQCLTGDGRYVVAVVAPWSASNSEGGVDHGGLAYSVDAHTGAVRPLAGGVAPVYFNPGCGSGHDVALTAYAGPGQHPTVLRVLDASTGAIARTSTVAGELTSAVPAAGRILAARGAELVDATDGAHPSVLARMPERVAELRPAADGGVDFLAQGDQQSVIWHWAGGHLLRVGAGRAAVTHLFGGAGGRNLASGASQLAAGSTVRAVPAPPSGIASVSTRGGLVLAVQHASTMERSGVAGGHVTAVMTAGGRTTQADLKVAGAAFTAVPSTSIVAASGSAVPSRAAASQAVTNTPACAVARDDIFKQAMQPASNQVRWAVLQAVQSGLTALRPANNTMYAVNGAKYAPLAQAAPSSDFPLGTSGPTVPPLVVFGILAQESNWAQASPHSAPGRSGNPLIANYYGLDSTSSSPVIDYSKADCGYGLGQLTDIMQMPPSGQPTDQQVRVAVDYATNVAAAVQNLKFKWTQLQSLGITLNDNDPTKIENWYAAIWAYNSGVHTDPNSAHGLGWLNNPANPIYPRRTTFLHTNLTLSPDDAKTPNHWPYQERVFGWMEVPQVDSVGYLRYRGTYDWDTAQGNFLNTPGYKTFCSTSVNSCDPALVGTGSDPCPSESSLCWWNASASWVNCSTSCITDTPQTAPQNHTYYSAPGTPEPAAQLGGYPTPTIGCATPGPGTGATIVSDLTLDATKNPQRLTPNLMGCSVTDNSIVPAASTNGSFQLLDANGNDVLSTPGSLGAIDLHQLGAGLGGHTFFTHTGAPLIPYVQNQDPEVKAVWTATLPADPNVGTVYEIKPFIPDIAAGAGHATYEINVPMCPAQTCPGQIQSQLVRTIDQRSYSNSWASLGYYLCGGDSTKPTSCTITVTLRTTNPADDPTLGADIAMGAVAFVPVPTGGYVSIGDSYSSGEGVAGTSGTQATFDDGTDVTENAGPNNNEPSDTGNMCHRSALAWPRLFAARENLPIVHLACSGANLGDLTGDKYSFQAQYTNVSVAGQVLGATTSYALVGPKLTGTGTGEFSEGFNSPSPPWYGSQPNVEQAGSAYFSEQAPQVDLLRALRPKLVTLTIGGNDIGFADLIQTCFFLKANCDQNFKDTHGDLIDNRIASLQPRLAKAYQLIKADAPGANIYVLTYPAILTTWPGETAASVDCTGIEHQMRAWLGPKAATLDTSIKAAAAAVPGIKIVDLTPVFVHHEVCSDQVIRTPTYITDPPGGAAGLATSTTSQKDNWYHPNQAGQQAISDYLVAQGVKPAP